MDSRPHTPLTTTPVASLRIDAGKLDPYKISRSFPCRQGRQQKIVYEIPAGAIIDGNIAGKEVEALGNLSINGNVSNCSISLIWPELKQCYEAMESERKRQQKEITPDRKAHIEDEFQTYALQWEQRKEQIEQDAVNAGMQLSIRGNVSQCQNIYAPNLSITGNLDANHEQGCFIRCPGNVHINGDVTGKINKDFMQQLETRTPPNELATRLMRFLHKIKADNIRISGDIENMGLEAKGTITIGGRKSGYIITKKGDLPETTENRPDLNSPSPAP